jgi:hypothetical protein
MSDTPVVILGYSYSKKFVYDAISYIISKIISAIHVQSQLPILGFVIRRTFHQTEITVELLYRNDVVAGTDFPMDDDIDDMIDDAVVFFLDVFEAIKRTSCSCCSSEFYTTVDRTHCSSCIKSLLQIDITENINTDDNCYICLEPIGKMDVGAFSCAKHYGHIKCIGMFNRSDTNPRYSCPSRCEMPQQDFVFEFTIDEDDHGEILNVEEEEGLEDNPI